MNQIRLFLCSLFSSKIDHMELNRKIGSLKIALALKFDDYPYATNMTVDLKFWFISFSNLFILAWYLKEDVPCKNSGIHHRPSKQYSLP